MSNGIQKMTQDIQNRIRELAYIMWESAGRQQGTAMQYWLAAEKEILATAQAAAEKMMPTERAEATSAKGQSAPVKEETKKEPAEEEAKRSTTAKPASRRTTGRASDKS